MVQMYDQHYQKKINRTKVMSSKGKKYCDKNVSLLYVQNNSRSENVHQIETSYVMLNKTFTNKIGLLENANIHKNIYYELIAIKGSIQIGTRPSFHETKETYF